MTSLQEDDLTPATEQDDDRSIPVSVVVICNNEEDQIRACLESVGFADELLVIDSYSTDDTVEIAEEHADRVVQREWNGINEQRNFGLEEASHDWVFALDADERVSVTLQRELISLFSEESDPDHEGYHVPRVARYLGRWILHGGWYPDHKLRLFKKQGASYDPSHDPHDHPTVDGECGELNAPILHYTYDDLSDQLSTIDRFSDVYVEGHPGKGSSWWLPLLMLVRPPGKFLETWIWKCGFLDGMAGFIISINTAFYVFYRLAKCWEHEQLEES